MAGLGTVAWGIADAALGGAALVDPATLLPATLLPVKLLPATLLPGVLLFARLLPVVVFTPLFGGATTPRRYRVGLTICFVLALLPTVPAPETGSLQVVAVGMALLREALAGLMLAVFVRAVFEVLASTGALVDLARGTTLANVYDPANADHAPILAAFYSHVFLATFFAVGGHHFFFTAVVESYQHVPLGQLPADTLLGSEGMERTLELLGSLFRVAVQFAAPTVLVLLVLDAGLGLLNRVAPQIQVTYLGLTVRPTLGIAMVLLSFGIVQDEVRSIFFDELRRFWPL